MKELYIVFIASNYKTGKTIRFLTGKKYNHVAIALSPELSEFHSFARNNHYEPLSGGYQIESPERYLKGENLGSEIKVCKIRISDKKFERITDRLRQYSLNREDTLYNFFDIVTYPFKKHLCLKNAHTCVSFVQEILEIDFFLSIGRLEYLLRNHVIYEGKISEICKTYDFVKEYYEKYPLTEKYIRYAVDMASLLERLLILSSNTISAKCSSLLK